MKISKRVLLFTIIFSLLLCCNFLQSQTTRINSPYTLFGIGNLNNTDNSAISMSMGGIKYALRHHQIINAANPASYTAFDSLSFLFEGAMKVDYVTIKSSNVSENTLSASLNYLTFGFPVTNWWKSSIGLLPYSNVGYKVAQDQTFDNIGAVRFINDGSGGLNQVYWGNGFRLAKNFSIGINAAYVFGTIDHGLSVIFPDSTYYFSTREDHSIALSDFVFTYGMQYTIPFKNDLDLTLGATFSNKTKLHAEKDYLVRNFYGEVNNIRYYKDTIVNNSAIKGDVILPVGLGVGFMLKKKNKWLIGGDFNWQQWEDYSSFGESDSLKNRMNFAIGAQYIPEKYSIFSYFDMISYRLGIRYTNSYLELNGQQLTEFGISFGFGFPVRKSKSMFNIGCEIGKWGTTSEGLIQENFIKFTVAVSIYENWFIKPKYK